MAHTKAYPDMQASAIPISDNKQSDPETSNEVDHHTNTDNDNASGGSLNSPVLANRRRISETDRH